MKPFTFHQPSTVSEAVGLLAEHGRNARPIAGGQSLMLEMKERQATPSVLVSLSELAELKGWVYSSSGELEVGATTTYAQLIAAEGLRGWHPVVSAMAGDLADRPVRTMGTIGGSLCQADPRFDMPVLVVGANAVADTVSPSGVRTRDAVELFAEGGGSALAPDELLTRIRFPDSDSWTGVAFEKFRIRQFDSALASVFCALTVGSDGRVAVGRLTVGAVRPAPYLVGDAAQLLIGLSLPDDPIAAVSAVVEEVLPMSTVRTHLQRYQRELMPALIRHAVARAFEQSGS